MSYGVMSCDVMSYHVTSCDVMSCNVMSGHVMCCHRMGFALVVMRCGCAMWSVVRSCDVMRGGCVMCVMW